MNGAPALLLVEQILGFYFCFTLVATALAKVRSYELTRATVAANLSLPRQAGHIIVVLVIAGEFALAGMTAGGGRRAEAAALLAMTFIAFALYRSLLLARNRTACACAGEQGTTSRTAAKGQIASNLIVAALAVLWGAMATGTGPALHAGAAAGCALPLVALAAGHLRNRRRTRGSNLGPNATTPSPSPAPIP